MKKLSQKQKNNIVGGAGYYWKCTTTGWESGWHITYSGAVTKAYDHERKYSGHKTVVYAA